VATDRDLADPEQRRASTGAAEHPFEPDGIVEVSADGQLTALKCLDTGQLPLSQPAPRLGVSGQRHVGLAPGGALADACTVGGTADLPRMPEIAQLDVIGRVKARIGTEVAIGQRAERFVYAR
jgi:hypothetical protein